MDLSIDRGESAVIIGGSGCGKSVLLRHIIGLIQPDSGDVKINGESIVELNERQLIKVRRKFGMLFEGAALFDSLTVEENVGFLLDREQTLSRAEIKRPWPRHWNSSISPAHRIKPANSPRCANGSVWRARLFTSRKSSFTTNPPRGLSGCIGQHDQLVIKMRDQLNCTSIVVTHDTRSMRRVGNRDDASNGVIHANETG